MTKDDITQEVFVIGIGQPGAFQEDKAHSVHALLICTHADPMIQL